MENTTLDPTRWSVYIVLPAVSITQNWDKGWCFVNMLTPNGGFWSPIQYNSLIVNFNIITIDRNNNSVSFWFLIALSVFLKLLPALWFPKFGKNNLALVISYDFRSVSFIFNFRCSYFHLKHKQVWFSWSKLHIDIV